MPDSKHNLNALLIGTGEFSFSENATTVAAALAGGFLDVGNVKAFTPKQAVTSVIHKGSYRGKLIRDKKIVTSQDIDYNLTCEEWKLFLLKLIFGASSGTGFTQLVQAAAPADVITFSVGTPSDKTKWYDITASGKRIMRLTAVTVSTLVEGTDFEVDYLLGKIRFLVAQTTAKTPTITAPAITSSDPGFMYSMIPGGKLVRSGIGRLTCYDQNNQQIVWDHRDFLCDLTVDTTDAVDGEKWSGITVDVSINPILPGELFIASDHFDV